uniref:RRM domain-containing protein n=1 Tax=Tetranychus urticae TaxID=32264 RepID=T1L1H2_TETUR
MTETEPPSDCPTSRLVVKNLPNSITGDKLSKLFSTEAEITDLQLKFKKNGKFRNFAFVGYKTEDAAARAKEAMDNTCIGRCKISVEFCRKLYDHQSDSKSAGSAKKDKNKQKQKQVKAVESTEKEEDENDVKDSILSEYKQLEKDPEFVEFVQTQRNIGSSKKKIWENDDVKNTNEDSDKKKPKKEKKQKEIKPNKPSVKGTFKNTIKLKRFPIDKCKKRFIKEFLNPLKPISIRVAPKQKGIAYASFKTEEEVIKALGKNRSVYSGHLVTVLKYEVKDDEPEKPSNPKGRVEKQVSEDVLVETGRIFVRNLYYQCKEEDLEKLFNKYGPIAEVHLPIDSETKKIKGFGFVAFVFPEHAIKAFNELDGTIFQGRTLHLIPGEMKTGGEGVHLESKSSFKKGKELENKTNASKGFNWNSLFLNFNAISDLISERYDVKKSQLLMEGKPSESIPVRMALAETQIVTETAKYLSENGVKLNAFHNSRSPRSKTVFLIKNLPAKTDIDELKKLVEQFGTVKRIILPPFAVTALVEADNPVEARTMFSRLAYSNFHLVPLYLEWAPMDVFGSTDPDNSEKDQHETKDLPEKTNHTEKQSEISKPLDEPCEEETTILVKGLNFSTDEENLKEHFMKCGKIHKVTISRKKAADGSLKSMGFGFVQFYQRKAAQKAMKSLQNSVLDNFTLTLQLSRVQKDKSEVIKAEKEKKTMIQTQNGAKILVRNIPFEAVDKDIEQLFEAFGQLKFVRLPKKLAGTGNHRGFGFVEFINKEDAARAFDALSLSTHLLGRRLVLEWAAKESDDNEHHESLEEASRKMKYYIDKEPTNEEYG